MCCPAAAAFGDSQRAFCLHLRTGATGLEPAASLVAGPIERHDGWTNDCHPLPRRIALTTSRITPSIIAALWNVIAPSLARQIAAAERAQLPA
jgi:hypothetical protein